MAKVTLRDIAAEVGVSLSTVSEAMRSPYGCSKRVGVETHEKILEAAKRLNYSPNASARALATGRSGNVGFFISSSSTLGIANHFFSTLLAGVQSTCEDRGYNCIVSVYDMESIDKFTMPTKIEMRAVDGIVIVGYIADKIAQKLIDSGIPFIVLAGKGDWTTSGFLEVKTDMFNKWFNSFKYLHSLGHRSFGVGAVSVESDRKVVRSAVDKLNLICSNSDSVSLEVYECEEEYVEKFCFGAEIAKSWVVSKERPTAILGCDQFCVGFLGEALRCGVKCPSEVSVLSLCDSVLCERFYPKITRICEPLVDNASAATELILDLIEKKITWIEANRKSETIWQKGELIIGESTGPASV